MGRTPHVALAALAACMITTPAMGQNAGAAKMIVLGNDGIAITNYPSMARCEAARAALQRLLEQENANNRPQTLPNGGVVFTLPLSLRTLCIPG